MKFKKKNTVLTILISVKIILYSRSNSACLSGLKRSLKKMALTEKSANHLMNIGFLLHTSIQC